MTYLPKKVAILVSRFNTEITERLLEGALAFAQTRADLVTTETFHVPGAVEIPLIAQKLAESKKYAAVVCLGAVVRGETSHYDYVCQQVSFGCQSVALKTGLPVIFGVLTTENEEQAFDRLGGKHGHKGEEAMDTAVQMLELIEKLSA